MNELRNLRYFLAVARHGSFTAAARRLALSTPALSKSIAGLEKKMGVALFVRTTRSVHLSSKGRVLFERLSPLFEGIDAAVHHVNVDDQEPVGQVTLSSVTAFGKHRILPLLPEFFALHPGIQLEMSFHDGARGLSRQTFDIRINWGERPEQGKVAQVLSTLPLTLVGSPQYLSRHDTPQKPEDLMQHECIATTLANNTRSHWIFTNRNARRGSHANRYEFIPRGRLTVMDELDAVVDAARIGLGLTVMSADCIIDELRNGSLVRLLPQYEITGNRIEQSKIVMQYPAKKHLAPKVAVLVHYLLDKLRGRNPLGYPESPPA